MKAETPLQSAWKEKQQAIAKLKADVGAVIGAYSHQSFYDVLTGKKELTRDQQRQIAKLFGKKQQELFPQQ